MLAKRPLSACTTSDAPSALSLSPVGAESAAVPSTAAAAADASAAAAPGLASTATAEAGGNGGCRAGATAGGAFESAAEAGPGRELMPERRGRGWEGSAGRRGDSRPAGRDVEPNHSWLICSKRSLPARR